MIDVGVVQNILKHTLCPRQVASSYALTIMLAFASTKMVVDNFLLVCVIGPLYTYVSAMYDRSFLHYLKKDKALVFLYDRRLSHSKFTQSFSLCIFYLKAKLQV